MILKFSEMGGDVSRVRGLSTGVEKVFPSVTLLKKKC